MKIRPVKRDDLERIDEIYRQGHDEHFSLPELKNTVTSAIVEKDGIVLGFGVVKLYAEAIMVLDLNKSKLERVDALETLLHEAHRGCEEWGITQLHVYVQDPMLQRLLCKRFGFKVAEGVALVKEI